MAFYRLAAKRDTVRVDVFDAAIPPVLTIASGDTVEIECVNGARRVFPPPGSGLAPTPTMLAIDAADIERTPGHIVTGPVAVTGAEAGDTLEVRVDAVALGADWGFCGFRPLAGTLPHDFERPFLTHIPIDRARNICRLPYGLELPLNPFFGVMGVAPSPRPGHISTIEPREHGGNIDLKELVAGTSLFLPIWAPGGLFSTGDGHGLQGTARSAPTRWRCASPAPSRSSSTAVPRAPSHCATRAPRRRRTSSPWAWTPTSTRP